MGEQEEIRDPRQWELLQTETKIIAEFGKTIGETTNNVGIHGIIEALEFIKSNLGSKHEIQFYLDSTLVVNQLNGLFKNKRCAPPRISYDYSIS